MIYTVQHFHTKATGYRTSAFHIYLYLLVLFTPVVHTLYRKTLLVANKRHSCGQSRSGRKDSAWVQVEGHEL